MENPYYLSDLPETAEDFLADQFSEVLKSYLQTQRLKPKKINTWCQYFDHSEQSSYFHIKFTTWDGKENEAHAPLWGVLGMMWSKLTV